MPTRQLLTAALAAVLVATGCSRPDVPAVVLPADATRLEAAITATMDRAAIPGALVGVWAPDGEYVNAFGVADTGSGTPMEDDFFSRIGSVTKTFTATAVLQLAQRRALDLDDPIARHIEGVPNGDAITVRHLATMRSGLADYTTTPEFERVATRDPGRDVAPRQLLDWAFARPPDFAPGARWQYCNTNYIVLGLLVEKLTGQTLPGYLSEQIFTPLGLSTTSFPVSTEFPEPHATGYTEPDGDPGPAQPAPPLSATLTGAAGAIISTLADMRVWARAVADGALLSPDLQDQRLQNAAGDSLGPGLGYGIGLLMSAGWIGHNGSLPGFQSVVVHHPRADITLVVMTNSDVPGPDGRSPGTALATAITTVVTPESVYDD